MDQKELNAALEASPSPDRITPEYLKSRIASVVYHRLTPVLTLCVVTLDNGFSVTGESACADPANYNEGIGNKIAYDVAERKIWPLLGFMLREALHHRGQGDVTLRGEISAIAGKLAAPRLDDHAQEFAAMVAHEANRAYCAALGDLSHKPWAETPGEIQDSARRGVAVVLDYPDAPVETLHDSWSHTKKLAGWTYGPEKNAEKRTHPCLVPFGKLPAEQQAKDYLFRGVVRAVLNV